MKLTIAVILFVIIIFIGFQIHSFVGRENAVKQNYLDLGTRLSQAKQDQGSFKAELDYYLNPVNLEKELRARFNYKRPDEKLIIIVPKIGTSTSGQ